MMPFFGGVIESVALQRV